MYTASPGRNAVFTRKSSLTLSTPWVSARPPAGAQGKQAGRLGSQNAEGRSGLPGAASEVPPPSALCPRCTRTDVLSRAPQPPPQSRRGSPPGFPSADMQGFRGALSKRYSWGEMKYLGMSREEGKGTMGRGGSSGVGNLVIGFSFFIPSNAKLALVFYQASGWPHLSLSNHWLFFSVWRANPFGEIHFSSGFALRWGKIMTPSNFWSCFYFLLKKVR